MFKLLKKTVAIFLSILTLISIVPVFDVSAATTYKPDWANSGIIPVKSIPGANADEDFTMLKVKDEDGNYDWAYCIQPGKSYNNGTEVVKNDSNTWNSLDPKQQEAVYLSMLYGAEGNFDAMEDEISNLTYEQAYVATQLLIWEFINGERNPTVPYNLVPGKGGYISAFCDGGNNPFVKKAYDFIINSMSDFYEIPSFAAGISDNADTHYLQAVKQKNGTWNFVGEDIVLTDNNDVLENYKFSNSSVNVGNGTLKVTQSDNELIISGVSVKESGTAKTYTIEAERKLSSLPSGGSGNLVSYGSDSNGFDDQDVVTMVFDEDSVGYNPYADPPQAYLKVGITLSKAERDFYVQKVCKAIDAAGNTTNINDAESLSGWYFQVMLPEEYGGSVYLGPTDSTGKTQTVSEAIQSNSVFGASFDINNVPVGTYLIRERGKRDSSGNFYFPDGWSSPYTNDRTSFVLSEDSGMNEVVNFRNNYKMPIQIKKTFEDGAGGSNPYYFLLSNVSNTSRYLLKSNTDGYLTVVKSFTSNSYKNENNSMYLEMGSYKLTEWGQLKSGVTEGSSIQSNYTIPDRYTAVTELPVVISATELKKAKQAGYECIYAEAVNIVSYPIVIIKADDKDSTKKLSGAVFGIYSDPECKKLVDTVTTNSNGEGVTDRLRNDNNYYVKEITPPVGYTLDSTIHTVYVHHTQSRITLSDGTEAIPVYADNELTPGFAAIKKVDDASTPVKGASFNFYRKSDNILLERGLKTDSAGIATTNKAYDPGLYYFKEISAPKGYSVDKVTKYEVEIKESTNVNTTVIVYETYYADTAINPRIKSYAAIYKYDQDQTPLAGAVFSFYKDGSTTALETGLVTNSEGLAKTKYTYNPGEYYFVETKAPDGYQLDTTESYVTIKMNETSTTYFAGTMINTVNSSKIAVHKIDYYYGYSLENAEFGIYEDSECKTEARDFITTDATGYGVSSESFKPGIYYLKETKAPAGHSLSDTIHTVTISKTSSTTNVVVKEIPNTPLPQQIQVKKVDENTGVALQGAQFQVRKPAENMLDRIWLTDEFSTTTSGTGWKTKEWDTNGSTKTITYTSEVSDTVGVDGSGAIKIDVTQVKGDARGRVYLDLKPSVFSDVPQVGHKYTFSCRVRTENIVPAAGVSEYGAQITPIFVNTSGSPSGAYATESDAIDYNTDLSINNGFVYISVDFTLPESVMISGNATPFSYLRLTLALRGATGTAYFDDIKLTSNEYCAWQGSSIANATQSYYYVDSDTTPNSYQMNVSSTNITGISGRMMQNIDINEFESDRNYTFSCYIKVDSLQQYVGGADYGVRLSAFFLKSGAGYPVGGTFYSKTISNITSESINNGYIYLSVDFIAPNATDLATCSALNVRVEMINATGNVYIKQPRVYLNDKYENYDSYKKAAWGNTGSVTFTTEVSTDTYAFGGKSLKMNVTEVTVDPAYTTDKRGRAYYDVYGLTPGITYTLSAYVKVENLQKASNATTYGANIAGTIFKTDGNTAGNYYSNYVTSNTSDSQNSGFIRISRDITIPSTYSYLRINPNLRGATGTVYFDEIRLEPKNTVLTTLTTNNNGVATYNASLYSGEYEFMEILAPNGYYFSNATSVVNVNPDTYVEPTVTSTITNEPIKRSFSLIKYDNKVYVDNYVYNRQVAGATYVMCDAPTLGTKLATATTKADTPTTFVSISTGEQYDFVVGDSYYLKETVAPYGYIMDTNWYKVTITVDGYEIAKTSGASASFDRLNNAPDTIVVEDDSIRGKVKITKKFISDNEGYKSTYFSIYDASTGYICRFDQSPAYLGAPSPNTNSASGATSIAFDDGETRTISNLPVGLYYIQEVSVVDGYIPYQGRIYFEIKPNSTGTACDIVELTVNNYEVLLWNTGGAGATLINPIGLVVLLAIPIPVVICLRRKKRSSQFERPVIK